MTDEQLKEQLAILAELLPANIESRFPELVEISEGVPLMGLFCAAKESLRKRESVMYHNQEGETLDVWAMDTDSYANEVTLDFKNKGNYRIRVTTPFFNTL